MCIFLIFRRGWTTLESHSSLQKFVLIALKLNQNEKYPFNDVSIYSPKFLMRTFSFLLLNIFYMKCHVINHFLLMLRNFFLSVCMLCLFTERFETIYGPSLKCQASCQHQWLLPLSFLFVFPGRQELNSRLRCRSRFGLVFPFSSYMVCLQHDSQNSCNSQRCLLKMLLSRAYHRLIKLETLG